MTLFGTRTAAAELSRLLDGGAALAAGASAGSPAQLAGLALRLQAAAPALAATAAPRAEFRAALRTRLVAVASVQAVAAPSPVRNPVRAAGLEAAVAWSRGVRAGRGVGLAVGAMASVVVVAGVGAAGTQSLPGEPFYGVKRAVEGLELRTADGALERGSTHLEHASARLDEVAALTRGRDAVALAPTGSGTVAGGRDASLVVETLADMDTATRAAARLLVEAAAEDGTTAPLEQLTTFAVRQDRRLSALVPELPLAAQERAADSLALVDEVGDDALALILDELPSAPLDPAVVLPSVPLAPAPADPAATAPSPSASADAVRPAARPVPARSPESGPAADPATTAPGQGAQPAPEPTPSPTRTSAPEPALQIPVPSLPVPLPLPLPSSVPLPVPALPLPESPLVPQVPTTPGVPTVPETVGGVVDGVTGAVDGAVEGVTGVLLRTRLVEALAPEVLLGTVGEVVSPPTPALTADPAPAPRPGSRPVAP